MGHSTSCPSTLLSGVPRLITRRAGQSSVDIINYRDMTLNLSHTYNLFYHRTACHKKAFFTTEASLRMDSTTSRREHPKQIWLAPLIFLMKSVNRRYWVVSLSQVTVPGPTSWDNFQQWEVRCVDTMVYNGPGYPSPGAVSLGCRWSSFPKSHVPCPTRRELSLSYGIFHFIA